MISLSYKIQGVAPILFHNVNSMDLVKPKTMTHQEFENSEEMFKARLYLEEKDVLTLAPRVILGTLKQASKMSGMKQDGKRANYSELIKAAVFSEPFYFDQKFENVERHKEYVTVNNSKVLRVFPILKKWSGSVTITVEDKQLPIEVIDELFNYAGLFCGYGDYSPQYGRFTVKRVKK